MNARSLTRLWSPSQHASTRHGQQALAVAASGYATKSGSEPSHRAEQPNQESSKREAAQKKRKTLSEMDEELRAAMEGRAGDGGVAGAELEGGQAVGLKRSVKENMFRYI